jgi:vanillate O-demethylase ferredoxin subunit
MLTVRVADRRALTDDVVWLELRAVEGELPPFTAGAHIDLHLAGGLVRQYSLCNDPEERHRYGIAVLREAASRGGSRSVHEDVVLGGVVKISPPRNLFALDEGAGGALLFAGGIGVTPIKAMAHRLCALGRPYALHYCVRERRRAAFAGELAGLGAQLHLDDEPATRLDLEAVLAGAARDWPLYVCGPAGFIAVIRQGAERLGWPPAAIRSEHFQSVASVGERPFDLVLARDGRRIRVGPDQTAAEALAGAGIEVPLSCEQGVCGTCLTPVLAGLPDHRDLIQTDAEKAANACFTPCCSRALSAELVIDL